MRHRLFLVNLSFLGLCLFFGFLSFLQIKRFVNSLRKESFIFSSTFSVLPLKDEKLFFPAPKPSPPPVPVRAVANPEVIPDSIMLEVPFTSQAPEGNWEQPWQDACEEAAILMLDAYYKKYNLSPLFSRDELLKLVQSGSVRGWGGSIELEKVLALLSEDLGSKGFGRLVVEEDPTAISLKRALAKGAPILVVANGKKLPNPNFRGGGPAYHALLIVGYNETEFITNDPGTRLGKNFAYKIEDLLAAMADWNGGNVEGGRKVVAYFLP